MRCRRVDTSDSRLRTRTARKRSARTARCFTRRVRTAKRERRRRWNRSRRASASVRTLLHDQAGGQRHGPRVGLGLRDRPAQRRFISVDSELGRGPLSRCTFQRSLVRARSRVARRPLALAVGRAHAAQRTILLVEDEDSVRSVASALLRQQGYHVLEASTPRAAMPFSSCTPVRSISCSPMSSCRR